MARRTKKKTAPKVSTRSKKKRVKNAGKKGGTRVIPGSTLFEIFHEKSPLAVALGKGIPSMIESPDWWLEYGDVKLEKKPTGLWARGDSDKTALILPTDTTLDEMAFRGAVSPYSEYVYYPITNAGRDVRATHEWGAPQVDAINALERWQYRDATIMQGAEPDPEILIVPPQEISKDKSGQFARTELRNIATLHKRGDLLPPGHKWNWSQQQVEEAQEAITAATGHEFGEHDPTFVAPVTEEGWEMLDEIYKEGVPPKRSSNPQTLHVTPRRKKIAAQIDRQLADLPQNATLTDRQVKQILAALAS